MSSSSLLIRFAPALKADSTVFETSCLKEAADTCLVFLRLGMGKVVYVDVWTFSSPEDLHWITCLFFSVVAFSVALPFTLVGMGIHFLFSPNEKIYEAFKNSMDVGGSLRIKENARKEIHTLSQNNSSDTVSIFTRYQNQLMEGIQDLDLWIPGDPKALISTPLTQRLLLLNQLSHQASQFNIPFSDLSLLSEQQIEQILFNHFRIVGSYSKNEPTGAVSTLVSFLVKKSLEKQSLEKKEFEQILRLIATYPLLKGIKLFSSPHFENLSPEDRRACLKYCGFHFLCFDPSFADHSYPELIDDLMKIEPRLKATLKSFLLQHNIAKADPAQEANTSFDTVVSQFPQKLSFYPYYKILTTRGTIDDFKNRKSDLVSKNNKKLAYLIDFNDQLIYLMQGCENFLKVVQQSSN